MFLEVTVNGSEVLRATMRDIPNDDASYIKTNSISEL